MHRIYKVIGRLPVVLSVLLATMLTSACSFKTVYNRLDYLIVEYVGGMVTLDDVLESDLERRSELLLDWHRSTQLRQYAGWFRQMQADTGPDLDDETLRYHVNRMETYWRAIREQLNTEMAEFLPQLSGGQRDELFESLEEHNEDFREEFVELDDDERLDSHIERLTDMYEDWLGDLSDDQLLAIRKAATGLKSGAERRYQLRLEWQAKIRQVLDADVTQQKKQELLADYFDGFDLNRDPVHSAIYEANKAVLRALTLEIVHSLSPEQKTYFDYRTDEYIRMFEELAENR